MKTLTGQAYGASVRIGHALCNALHEGATHDDLIEALEHSIKIAERNRDMGIPESALAKAEA